jgi:hypothetical protein
MGQTVIRLVILLFAAGSMNACAYHPAAENDYIEQPVNCRSVEYNYSDRQDCYVEEYPPYTNAESVFGYIIFRSVIEGLIHGLVYH